MCETNFTGRRGREDQTAFLGAGEGEVLFDIYFLRRFVSQAGKFLASQRLSGYLYSLLSSICAFPIGHVPSPGGVIPTPVGSSAALAGNQHVFTRGKKQAFRRGKLRRSWRHAARMLVL